MLTTGSIICNKFSCTPSPNLGLQITFQMFNREFNITRDGRMWMSSSGGIWETQIGDANVGRVWIKDRFGLGAVGVVNYVLNCVGQARFTSAVQFIGTDSAISLNNGSYLNFANNGSIRRYTPDAIEGLYMAHVADNPTTKLAEFEVLLFLIIKSFVSTYISALSIISFEVSPN